MERWHGVVLMCCRAARGEFAADGGRWRRWMAADGGGWCRCGGGAVAVRWRCGGGVTNKVANTVPDTVAERTC